MSAAIEAGMGGIPAIGFSLLNYNWDADFSAAESYIKTLCLKVLEKGLEKGIVLNVNFPDLAKKDIKGLRVCRQANANWVEKFDKRQSPMGRNYYWLTGEFINQDKGEDTDEWALKEGYISVVPVQFDLTAHQYLKELKTWDLNG
jgi:5'-nucleotidase